MDINELRAAILRGEYDPHLVDIAGALNERFQSDDGPISRWRVTIDGQEMTEDDLTVAEAAQIERLTGNTWSTVQPLASAEITQAFAIVTLQRGGMSSKDAVARVGAMGVIELLDCCDRYQSDPPTSPAGD